MTLIISLGLLLKKMGIFQEVDLLIGCTDMLSSCVWSETQGENRTIKPNLNRVLTKSETKLNGGSDVVGWFVMPVTSPGTVRMRGTIVWA
jgi:hypothetical protein